MNNPARSFFDAPTHPRPSAIGAWSAAALAIAALLMGGATALWAQIIVAFAIGALLFIFPPRRALGWWPVALMICLLLIACAAFLPDHWFGIPPWKQHLMADLGLEAGGTRTPQPVFTLEAAALFALGLLWTYWTLAFDWGRRLRIRVCRGLVVGVSTLAVIAVYCFYSGAQFPLWDQAENRGFFPNRNQMADVLVLCGILNYALLYEGLRRRRWWNLGWLLPLAAIAAGLVMSYSRAGILLGFTGIVLWHSAMFFQSRSLKNAAVAIAALAVAGALFLLCGSTTLERFAGPVNGGGESQRVLEDFRIVIQKDAFHFTKQSPWLGVGLGNFSPLFAMQRERSAMPNLALHPESDWLWAACELGWPAVALLLAGLGWWAWKCVRIPGPPVDEEDEDEPWNALRFAAALGVILFVLHGLVDVSGHRLGSAMFAMLLAGLAMPLQELPGIRWESWARRALGVLPILIGNWWLGSLQGDDRWPSSATVAQQQVVIQNALASDDFKTVAATAQAALQIARLDARFYFQRGYANAVLGGDMAKISADFARATALQPAWPDTSFDIGNIWLTAGYHDLALAAWTQTLHQAGDRAPDFYRRMLQAASGTSPVRAALRNAAFQDPKLLFVSLQNETPQEANSDIAAYLLEEPELAALEPAQRLQFIGLWWEKGNRDQLISWLDFHPELDAQTWTYRADTLAAQKRFREAWLMVSSHVKPPALPRIPTPRPLAELQRDFLLHPDDFTSGYLLLSLQLGSNQDQNALFTLRKLAEIPDRPAYIFWVQAVLYAKRSGWPEAWLAWQQYQAHTH